MLHTLVAQASGPILVFWRGEGVCRMDHDLVEEREWSEMCCQQTCAQVVETDFPRGPQDQDKGTNVVISTPPRSEISSS